MVAWLAGKVLGRSTECASGGAPLGVELAEFARQVRRVLDEALREDLAEDRQAEERAGDFDELEQLLRLSGWTFERSRGSHNHYRRGAERLSMPFRRDVILVAYVRDVLRRTKEDGDE